MLPSDAENQRPRIVRLAAAMSAGRMQAVAGVAEELSESIIDEGILDGLLAARWLGTRELDPIVSI